MPSIAIREGVYKSLEITAEHFMEDDYNKRIRFFIYNSKQLHHLEQFSSDGGINVMIINVQAFNARGQDARRIYEELDDFQSRKPIDVIKSNNPIMILDEPQKLEGAKTFESLKEFAPLAILRYSATHKTEHNKIHRLDALDAYNQKLVKKIAVRGITIRGLTGTNAYLYLESIQISAAGPPGARIEFEVKQQNGIKRVVRKFGRNDNLFDLSGGLSQYKGFIIADIDAVTDTVSFTNNVFVICTLKHSDSSIHKRQTDDNDAITATYHEAKKNGALTPLPPELAPYAPQIVQLIDSVFSDAALPEIDNGRKAKPNPLNANLEKAEFKALWEKINRKAAYTVHFDTAELIKKCVATLDKDLRVTKLQYTVERGEQINSVTYDQLRDGQGFTLKEHETDFLTHSVHSAVKYDLIGKLAEDTNLTRSTITEILKGLNKLYRSDKFYMFCSVKCCSGFTAERSDG